MPNSQSLLVGIGQGLSLMTGLLTIASWKTEERPQNPKRGTFGFNSQTNSLELFDGNDWFEAPMASVVT